MRTPREFPSAHHTLLQSGSSVGNLVPLLVECDGPIIVGKRGVLVRLRSTQE